jgi:hypothetical protein
MMVCWLTLQIFAASPVVKTVFIWLVHPYESEPTAEQAAPGILSDFRAPERVTSLNEYNLMAVLRPPTWLRSAFPGHHVHLDAIPERPKRVTEINLTAETRQNT